VHHYNITVLSNPEIWNALETRQKTQAL